MNTSIRSATIAAVAALAFGQHLSRSSRAAISEQDSSSAIQNAFDLNISSTDLIENGSSAVASVSTNGNIAGYAGDGAQANSWANLTDGQASNFVTNNDLSHDTYFDASSSGASITYKLNTAASANGYDLSKISSILGWGNTTSFSNQSYRVSVAPVNSPGNFSTLATVNYAPFTGNTTSPNSSQVLLTDSTGALAKNVGAVKFTIIDNGGSGQVFRELDLNGAPSTNTPPPPPPVPATILPLGDSITYGDQGNGGPVPGGYRTKLYTDLQNKLSFNYVGSQTTNASATLTAAGQVNNEGHDGYRIDQIANNLTSSDGTGGNNGGHWLDGGNGTGRDPINPTYTLLHIGTNDILQHYDPSFSGNAPEATFLTDLEGRLHSLVSQLVTDRPDSKLLVASIIPIPNHADPNGVDENDEVKLYNAYIQNVLAPEFAAQNVYFVDQYDNFVNTDGSIKTDLLPDSIHPNQQGYDLMGDTWASAIESVPEPTMLGLLALVPLLARRRNRA